MGRIYRINVMCPYCYEEHMYWNISLTDEEQETLDQHTEKHKEESPLQSLLSDPGIVVKRKLKCCECEKEFQAKIGIWKENELGWHHPDYVEIGKYPV